VRKSIGYSTEFFCRLFSLRGNAGIFAEINKREHEPMSIPMSDEMYRDTREGAIPETRKRVTLRLLKQLV